jgi:hypothetical protein
MPALLIRIKKKADGGAALTCTRPDGSATWQRQEGSHARFFPHHDLTHYAVETVLGHQLGFYGLVASGWNLDDFGVPWPRGPIPADADPSELIVGFFDAERAAGARWSAGDFNEQARLYFAQHGRAASLNITDDELARIRALRAELFARWEAVPAGGALELQF